MLFGAKLRSESDKTIVNLVAVAHSLLDELVKEARENPTSQSEVQRRGANLLRSLSYPNGGYFWADTFEGNCVVLLGSPTEGKPRLDAPFKIFNGLWKVWPRKNPLGRISFPSGPRMTSDFSPSLSTGFWKDWDKSLKRNGPIGLWPTNSPYWPKLMTRTPRSTTIVSDQ